MATKNYMINDKWLDLDKQNIVELQSVDGVLDSLKVNGSEIETPSGKITITENGTDIDIAQYALADVAVEGGGSSDFSTAKLTVINNKEWHIQAADCPVALVEDEMLFGGFSVNANSQSVFDVIIYKGYAHILEIMTGASLDTPIDLETEASLSGNAVYNAEDELIDITGDCTITIGAGE